MTRGKLEEVLSPITIQAADQDGAAMTIEPGLNAVAYVGRSVDPGILIMRYTEFSPLGIPDQVRATLQGLDLADYRRGR